MSTPATVGQLVVFSDDWGRHPSSTQHLVRHLLPRWQVLWVNTIGTRLPSVSLGDLGKVWKKLRQWTQPPESGAHLPSNLTVVTPRMWPGFRRRWQRSFNARQMTRAVSAALGPRQGAGPRVALTTLPITADLVGRLPVDRWVYCCVDDFSVWPGVDGPAMLEMERELARRVHAAAAVSETLVRRLEGMGRPANLLTHGIDLDHWRRRPGPAASAPPAWLAAAPRPLALFWGLIDRRLDLDWARKLLDSAKSPLGALALVGPRQDPDPELLAWARREPRLLLPGAVPFDLLPQVAAGADVLVMPYADLPVTRAMQPLKFKEYLAAGFPDAGRPVVVRDLPATRPWSDAADVVGDADAFLAAVTQRVRQGLPAAQQAARQRLTAESWESKARQMEMLLTGQETAVDERR